MFIFVFTFRSPTSNWVLSHKRILQFVLISLLITEVLTVNLDTATSPNFSDSGLNSDSKTVLPEGEIPRTVRRHV